MRRLIERLHAEVAAFVEQREDLILAVTAAAADVPIALKVLRDAEMASPSDVFMLFGDDFEHPAAYVDALVAGLAAQCAAASRCLADEGRAPLAPLPAGVRDASRAPGARLVDAIAFARDLLPRQGGHRLVWAMMPQRIARPDLYYPFAAALIPARGLQPWMRGVRVVLRRTPPDGTPLPDTLAGPRVRAALADFSPAALASSFQAEAEDDAAPIEQRMQAVLMLAGLDYAHGRTQDAVAKYRLLLGHYQQTDNAAMQAVVLGGIGDVYRRAGVPDQAQHWYECALVPAARVDVPIVLAGLARNLGELAFEAGRYGDAEQYFDGLDKLAERMLDPDSKTRALEWRGLSQERSGALARAVQSWETAARLSRTMELLPNLRANLEHLRRAYRHISARDRLAAVEAELASLPATTEHPPHA